jgi:hypothetical protein
MATYHPTIWPPQTLAGHRDRARKRTPHRLMPRLEWLEDKLAPSAYFAVTGTADNIDASPHGGDGSAASPYQMSSLRGAVLLAEQTVSSPGSPNVINLPDGDYKLSLGQLQIGEMSGGAVINQNLQIVGTSQAGTIIEHDTTAPNDYIFHADPSWAGSVTFSIVNATIEHGRGRGYGAAITGGGPGDAISANNVRFFDNQNPNAYPGVLAGAIADVNYGLNKGVGNLTLTNCDFDTNSSVGNAGAIYYDGSAPDTLTVTACTFTNNSRIYPDPGAAPGGGAITVHGLNNIVNITGSVFAGNSSRGVGAGAVASFDLGSGTLAVDRSTFTNNTATVQVDPSRAIYNAGAIFFAGRLTINFNRFVGNSVINTAAGNQVIPIAICPRGSATGSSVDDNWWGSNNGPAAGAIAGIAANSFLEVTMSSAASSVLPNTSTSVTASFLVDSAGNTIDPSNLTALLGLPVSFTSTGGSITPIDATIQPSGTAQATFTAGAVEGTGSASALIDNPPAATVNLDILAAPVVTLQPVSQAAVAGQTVSFTAAARGNPTPTVQWQDAFGIGSFHDIPGATSTTYTVTAPNTINRSDWWLYRAAFTNSYGTTYSSNAVLDVYVPTVITAQPVDTWGVASGPNQKAASFTAAATGSWQRVVWQVSTDGGATFSDFATHFFTGSASDTLYPGTLPSQDGYQFRAVFSTLGFTGQTIDSATSAAAKLTVYQVPVIVQQPPSEVWVDGQYPITPSFAITATVSSNAPFQVKWQRYGYVYATQNYSAGTQLIGYAFPPGAAYEGRVFWATVSNPAGTVDTTGTVVHTYVAPQSIYAGLSDGSGHYSNVTVVAGQTLTLHAYLGGVVIPAPSVQWQISTNGGLSFSNFTDGQTAAISSGEWTNTFTAKAAQNGAIFRVVFSNIGGSATTNNLTLTVQSATVSTVSTTWGSAGSAALQTAADGLRLLPAGRNTDLPWMNVNAINITLSSPATLLPGDVSVTGVNVANYGPVTISGSGTNYTITFAQKVAAADRVTVSISNAAIASFVRRLDILPGDVNDDGVVNSQDVVLVRNQIFGFTGAVPTTFGDINGDTGVDMADYNLVRQRVGTRLPIS